MILKVSNMQVNDKRKNIKKNKLRSLVVSGQYILKDMKRFTEAATLELKKMTAKVAQLS